MNSGLHLHTWVEWNEVIWEKVVVHAKFRNSYLYFGIKNSLIILVKLKSKKIVQWKDYSGHCQAWTLIFNVQLWISLYQPLTTSLFGLVLGGGVIFF